MFVRIIEDENGEEKRKYIYGGDGYGEYDEEEGLEEMREEAGIAMEYFEKNQEGLSEASFLEDWEVIYGADNYKVVYDYLKNYH